MSLAFVMINTIPDEVEAVLKDVKEIRGVEKAYMLYGISDIIAEVKGENFEELLTNLYEAVEACLSVDLEEVDVTPEDKVMEIAV